MSAFSLAKTSKSPKLVPAATLLMAAASFCFLLVCFGAASGQPAPFALAALGPKSLFVTRPSLFNYVLTRADLVANAKEVFKAYETGMFKVQKPKEYKLAQAAQAHKDLAGRKTTGPSILIP